MDTLCMLWINTYGLLLIFWLKKVFAFSAVAWVELLGGQPLLENKRKTRDHAVNNWISGLLGGANAPPAPPLPTGLLRLS